MGMGYMGGDKHKAYLFDYKQDKLIAGANITITENDDGKTATISASGGGEGTVTDVLVDGVSVVNQDGEAEVTMPTDFTGATAQQAGSHGLVPAPAIADKEKYLKGDGTWGEVSTVGDLEDLGDVNLSSPADGDALIYDAQNQEWVNGEVGGAVDDVQMNGQSIVANKIASFQNYVELTQSEYDALPASKLTDGILYCIKDTGIVEGEKFAPVIYSLEEREIGVWIDGKPLYEITWDGIVTISSSSRTYTSFYNMTDLNVEKCISATGYLNASVNVRFLSFADGTTYPIAITFNANSKTLQLITQGYTGTYPVCVTLRYTKTTDVPGSGKWGTNGVPTHHYSTTEQVIGTWIDGKPLYEKILINTQIIALLQNTWVKTEFNRDNINNIIECHMINISYSAFNSELSAGFVDNKLAINSARTMEYAIGDCAIVLQYTKTTD